jgi:hypothetical protein
MLVTLEVEPAEIHALERIGLLPRGERAPYAVACAVAQFLQGAGPVAQLGAALFPVGDGDR